MSEPIQPMYNVTLERIIWDKFDADRDAIYIKKVVMPFIPAPGLIIQDSDMPNWKYQSMWFYVTSVYFNIADGSLTCRAEPQRVSSDGAFDEITKDLEAGGWTKKVKG